MSNDKFTFTLFYGCLSMLDSCLSKNSNAFNQDLLPLYNYYTYTQVTLDEKRKSNLMR